MGVESETGATSPKRGCLYGWTDRQKCLLFFTIFLAIVTVAFISAFLYIIFTRDTSEKTCLTSKCTVTAATLISAMDSSVDPCEDFFRFTCADFVRKNPVPDEKLTTSTFRQYQDTYWLQIKDLIESHNPYGEPKAVFKAQEIYHVCINTTYSKKEELKAFKNFILDSFGGWPLAEGRSWKPNKSLEEIIGFANRMQSFSFFSVNLVMDPDKPELTIEGLIPSPLPNKTQSEEIAENEGKEESRKALLKYLNNLVTLLNDGNEKVSTWDLTEEFKKTEELETSFLEELREDMNQTETSEVMSVKEFNSTQKKLDWFKILNKIFEGIHVFEGKENITVKNLHKINQAGDFMKKSSRRVLINVLVWDVIYPSIVSLAGPDAEEFYHEYQKDYDEDYQKPVRWVDCLSWLQEIYPMVATRLFVNKYVDRKNKETADEMIQLIQQSYKEKIEKSEWLDEETKKKAVLKQKLRKLPTILVRLYDNTFSIRIQHMAGCLQPSLRNIKAESIKRYIGYPDFIFDDEKLEKEYENIPDVKATHFENVLWHEMNTYEEYFQHYIEKPVESQEKWLLPPLIINAFYLPDNNSIWFPSGILQLPFFDENRLAAVNFGMIGSVIGHEIGHAFDNMGSKYDETGALKNWWTNSTKRMFEKKTECFVKQYDKYCPEERQAEEYKCVNGIKTLGENLADNTGLVASYEAYQLWTNKHGREKLLPGLEKYSPEQLFFISFGYLWCENLPADKWDIYEDDPHSPKQYRSIGALSNYDKFREAFKCSSKSAMNRGSDSCVVW